MKFCQPHWDALRSAIEERGLSSLVADPEHPEWECPICFLNWLHAEHIKNCTHDGCDYPATEDYVWMIGRAADDQVAAWKEMRP